MNNDSKMNLNNKTEHIQADSCRELANVIPVQFDRKLLDILRARHNSRYSRSEAFVDLLLRMRTSDADSKQTSVKTNETECVALVNQTTRSTEYIQQSLFDDPHPSTYSLETNDSSAKEKKDNASPMSRHCVTNYSQLAAAWHWNRQTVLSFLKSLEDAGILLFEQKNKTVDIYI